MGWIGKEPFYANFPRQSLVGDGGAVYTLSIPGVTAGTVIWVNGAIKIPNTDYTVVDTTLTFTSNVTIGHAIEVLWLGKVANGVGSMGLQDSNSVSITGGSIAGITDLAVADGGTGVSTLSGIVKGNGTNPFTAAVSGTDYAPATSGSSILKGNGSGGFSSAVAGTDYAGLSSNNVHSVTSGIAIDATTAGTSYAIQGKSTNASYGGVIGYTADTTKYGILGHANQYALYGAGDVYVTGNVTAYSDIRYKINVKTIQSALDKVCKMRGVEYDRTDKEEHNVGVIAQEMVQVIPEVVHITPEMKLLEFVDEATGQLTKTYVQTGESILSVSYGNLVGVLIEAIKELKKEVDELKGK